VVFSIAKNQTKLYFHVEIAMTPLLPFLNDFNLAMANGCEDDDIEKIFI
jgi:hypothetical protein